MKYLACLCTALLIPLGSTGCQHLDDDVSIQSDFGSKVVYTTNVDADTNPYRAHCSDAGGEFNSCGSICAPDTEVCAEVCAYTCENIPEDLSADSAAWREYGSPDFGFSLEYPAGDWSAAEDTSLSFSPQFNFYEKPAGVPLELPIDHHDNVTNFSVFPHGVPTEGVFAQKADFDMDPGVQVSDESVMYLLEDGTPFAAYVKPSSPPGSWNQSGFLWMRVRIDSLETRCMRDGEEIGHTECDPLAENDRIVWTGTLSSEAWDRHEAILASFTFVERRGGQDLVAVSHPDSNDVITSPLSVRGEARGTWYFEASFPIVLTDWDGRIIEETHASAQGDWMTEDFVGFETELQFESPYSAGDPEYMQRGFLILRKANPSGLPENDGAVEIPVRFAPRLQ